MKKRTEPIRKGSAGKYEKRLSGEAAMLDDYLSRYRVSIGRKHSLEHRKSDIEREFNSPLKAVRQDGMPRNCGSGLGCAALSIQLDDINHRIDDQISDAVKVLEDVAEIIGYLDDNSMERHVLEQRYIDRHNWEQVCQSLFISRTSAFRYWRSGLYRLLDFKRVKNFLKEYQERNGDTEKNF